MQPNQQDSSQVQPDEQPRLGASPPNQPVPMNNTPEYLHLDPITLVPKKKKFVSKKIIVIVTLFVVFAVFVALGVLYWQWMQGEPERRFYSVLEKQLQTTNVHQKIKSTTRDPESELTIDINSDFTNAIQPKSSLTYAYSEPGRLIGTPKKTFAIEGSLILTSSEYFYSKLDTFPTIETASPITPGQWYKIANSHPRDTLLFDSADLQRSAPYFLGEMPIGSFEETQRQKVIEYIKANAVYDVHQMKYEQTDNRKSAVFSVRSTSGKLDGLFAKMNEVRDLDTSTLNLSSVTPRAFTVWVDDDSGRIFKIRQEERNDNGATVLIYESELDYPNKTGIEQPPNIKQRPSG